MKTFFHFISVIVALFSLSGVHGQWSIDPTNPLLVCSDANTRDGVQTQADGAGGVYVFWRDSRFDPLHSDVYGQHYNQAGVALWENNGREIVNYPSTISQYTTFKNETTGDLFIAAYTTGTVNGDSLKVRKLNAMGEAVWNNDLLISKTDPCAPPSQILTFENLKIVSSNDEYVLVYESTICGGYTQLHMTRFNSDGDMLTPLYGINIYGGGTWMLQPTYDNSGDFFVAYTLFDNGYEAELMRCTNDGSVLYYNVNLTSGPTSLSYKYQISSDEDGISFVWVSGGNIYARRFDHDGNQLWNDTTLNICEADGVQDAFELMRYGNELSVVWRDGRPGVVGTDAIYAQRFNTIGALSWPQDGIEVADLNTFAPYPKFAFTNNGEMVVCHASSTIGMTAQQVSNDGTIIWEANGIAQCIPTFNQSAEDFQVIQSGSNIIMAWQKTNGSNEIYISRLHHEILPITEIVSACGSYTFQDVTYTESGIYEIELPGDTLLTLDLTVTNVSAEINTNGNTLTYTGTTGTSTWINCANDEMLATNQSSFTPIVTGEYALVVELNSCVDTSECQLVTIIHVEDFLNENALELYPNPAQDVLNIVAPRPIHNASVTIIDIRGKRLLTLSNQSSKSFQLEVNHLARGMYFLEVKDAHSTCTMKWEKQ
jgi:hypothetical protein